MYLLALATLNRDGRTLGGSHGDQRFDVSVEARTEAGDTVEQEIYIDIND
jgi:hypothetical protein